MSDGIFESPHPERRELYGIERVVELFDRCKADSPAVIDFDKFTKDAEKLGKYCGNNPTHGLITAADKTLAED